MITAADADRLRDRLLSVLAEDAHNAQRLSARLDSISEESGIGAHAALLLILTRKSFDEEEARRHWEAILEHRARLSEALGRDVGLRVALLDYFVSVNRKLVQPCLIELELLEGDAIDRSRDGLTGLAGDRAFRSAVQNELSRAKRYDQETCLILTDLDDFAAVNETLGRIVGDRLIQETAILLANSVRGIDLVGRPGEDELAVLLPETGREGAIRVAERFRDDLAHRLARREGAEPPRGLTVSAGIACFPHDASAAEELIQAAALALYRAKASGKNQTRCHEPERRRYLRFELSAGRYEIEVLSGRGPSARPRNVSRNGLLFTSPEPLGLGEEIELRLAGAGEENAAARLRGRVVRLEELSGAGDPAADGEGYEVGVALDNEEDDLLGLLNRVRGLRPPSGETP